jgi:RNA 3'-terminal phosphate cyclase (ATP)
MIKMQYTHIDGSQGEGGGQVLRSSLALSLITGKAFTIDRIRANRSRPGLMKQHLTAVQAAAAVGQCKVDAKKGSVRLDFRPGKILGGDYIFDIGTAGSATLVLQTVLPALMLADEPSVLTLRGGTHNPMAPPFDFLDRVYLPLVRQLGPRIEATLVRPGFYPAGGGEFRVEVTPVKKLATLELMERGAIIEQKGKILLSQLPSHVAEREKKRILKMTGWSERRVVIETIENSLGPGNAAMLEVVSENVTELFAGFGEIRISAEAVAERTVNLYQDYMDAEVPVGEHLADQLMLPLGIAAWQGSGASSFRTSNLTRHSQTHIDILQQFLKIDIEVEQVSDRQVDVCLR